MNSRQYQDKIVVLTGGANGIGTTIAAEWAQNGARLAIIDKDNTAGEKLIRELPGTHHLFFAGDLGEETTIREFTKQVLDTYGHIDYLVNNACFSNKGLLSQCSWEAFNEVLRVGISAPYMLSLLFKDHFHPGGSIINISSTRAFMSQKDTESYTAAKGGIIALTHALAMSLSERRIRVNSISPGWIDTGTWGKLSQEDLQQHSVGKTGHPLDIVKAILFLCSEDAGFINGQNLIIDGGMTKRMIYHGEEGWTWSQER